MASFESGDFAYFVMREETDQGHAAAIGRVCKSDPGYANDQVYIIQCTVYTLHTIHIFYSNFNHIYYFRL